MGGRFQLSLVAALTVLSAAVRAVPAESDWKLCQYATLTNHVLTVDVPIAASNNTYMCQAPLDLTPFADKQIVISARVSGVNVSNATSVTYLGSKFMLYYKRSSDGTAVYTEGVHPSGTFSNLEHSFTDYNSSFGKRSASGVLNFGFQKGWGRYSLDLTTLKIEATDPVYPITNENYIVSYPPHVRVAEPRHGVMSPNRNMTEDDFTTLHEWGADLLRYQMNGFRAYSTNETHEAYLELYGAWLKGKLDHLDTVVLPLAEKYGIQVVVDLHTPPGAGGSGGNNSNAQMLNDDVFKDYFINLWRGIATRFKGRRNIYGYDLVNELNHTTAVKWDYWTIQSLAAEAVRAIDPNVTIIIESNGCDSHDAYYYLSPLAMDNVIYEVHMYSPGTFTHQGVSSRPTGYVYPDETQGWNKAYLENCFRYVRAFEQKHRAKIYVGEFSAIAWAEGAERWLADWIGVMHTNRWDWSYHAFREWNGWSVEHVASTVNVFQASSDNPRKRALLAGIREAPPVLPAVWCGAGNVSAAANWEGGAVPDLDRALTLGRFASGGSSATLDRQIALQGIELSDGFAFDGTNRLDLGMSGIRVSDAAAATAYTLGIPVAAGVSQTWYFGTNTVTDFMRPVWVDDGATVRLTGRGQAAFHAPGIGTNAVIAAGCADQAVRYDNVVLTVTCATNDVFGTGPLCADTRRTKLVFSGDFTWHAPVITYNDQTDWDQSVAFAGNLVFASTWCNTNRNTHLSVARGSRVVFEKPLKTSSSCYFTVTGSDGVAEVVCNAKLDVGDRLTVPYNMSLALNVATNRLNGNSGGVDGRIVCGVPYAIAEKNGAGTRTELFVNATGVLDLNGHDQALGVICAKGQAKGGEVTSALPATLHLVDSYTVNYYDSWVTDDTGTKIDTPALTNALVYTGHVTLSKEGRFTNRLTRVSTTSGSLIVKRGRLELTPGAAWPNAASVEVLGTGTLALAARSAGSELPFPRTVRLALESSTTLELEGALEVQTLDLDGANRNIAYAGSREAALANPVLPVTVLPCLRGKGLLHVLSAHTPTALFVR